MKLIIQDSMRVLGAYACPDAFVSQLVYFTHKPDLNWFTKAIVEQVGAENFSASDVRTATRHGWELGESARQTLEAELGADSAITEIYWTRYPRTEEQKRIAVSVCVGDSSRAGCLRLFAHDRDKVERYCPSCLAR